MERGLKPRHEDGDETKHKPEDDPDDHEPGAHVAVEHAGGSSRAPEDAPEPEPDRASGGDPLVVLGVEAQVVNDAG